MKKTEFGSVLRQYIYYYGEISLNYMIVSRNCRFFVGRAFIGAEASGIKILMELKPSHLQVL